jgi:hypothetical protein
MGEWLREIAEIQGVEGVLVCSNSGKILDKIGFNQSTEDLQKIARYTWRLATSYLIRNKSVKEIEFIYQDYRVIAMPKREFLVLTICKSSKGVSLVRMTVNVVVTHLLEDKKFIKAMEKEAVYKTAVLKGKDLDPREINLISKLQ